MVCVFPPFHDNTEMEGVSMGYTFGYEDTARLEDMEAAIDDYIAAANELKRLGIDYDDPCTLLDMVGEIRHELDRRIELEEIAQRRAYERSVL